MKRTYSRKGWRRREKNSEESEEEVEHSSQETAHIDRHHHGAPPSRPRKRQKIQVEVVAPTVKKVHSEAKSPHSALLSGVSGDTFATKPLEGKPYPFACAGVLQGYHGYLFSLGISLIH